MPACFTCANHFVYLLAALECTCTHLTDFAILRYREVEIDACTGAATTKGTVSTASFLPFIFIYVIIALVALVQIPRAMMFTKKLVRTYAL